MEHSRLVGSEFLSDNRPDLFDQVAIANWVCDRLWREGDPNYSGDARLYANQCAREGVGDWQREWLRRLLVWAAWFIKRDGQETSQFDDGYRTPPPFTREETMRKA